MFNIWQRLMILLNEWDESKRRNTRKSRGIGFADMVLFEWDTALTRTDNRWDYGEARLSSVGFI